LKKDIFQVFYLALNINGAIKYNKYQPKNNNNIPIKAFDKLFFTVALNSEFKPLIESIIQKIVSDKTAIIKTK
jgi:hypothetical protein